MDYADILMIGTGDLGGWVVEFLARVPEIDLRPEQPPVGQSLAES